MCTSITVTSYISSPLSRRTNIAGSHIIAHVTMETLSLFFRELKMISKKTAFLKDGLAKYDFSVG